MSTLASVSSTASSPPPSGAPITSSAAATVPSSVVVAVAPICTKAALQDAVNVGRAPDSQLTVSETDFKCQDTWAVAGANDPANKAQYSYVLRWADGQWQMIPDRSQACANQEIPATLFALGCQSN